MLLGTLLAQTDFNKTFGTITPPAGVIDFNNRAGGAQNIGLLVFVSTLIKLGTVVAGLWVLFNFLTAGLDYITSAGESKVQTEVKDKLTMSIVGLIIIVAAYTIVAVISLILFGKADYILNPTITSPTGATP